MKLLMALAQIQSNNFGITQGLYNNVSGFGEYHWHDVTLKPVPDSSIIDISSSGGGLKGTQEWGDSQILVNKNSNRAYFHVNPLVPDLSSDPPPNGDDGNKRAEIYQASSRGSFTANNPDGTEEWIGFNIRFGLDYIIDTVNPFGIFQSKPNDEYGYNIPPVAIQVAAHGENGATDGELILSLSEKDVVNNTYIPLGMVPIANTSIDIVIYIKHGQSSTGAVKVWINGIVKYDGLDLTTMGTPSSGGGTFKIGIYKWPWADIVKINESISAGQSNIKLSFGPLRVDRRFIGDNTYGINKYEIVKPINPYRNVGGGGGGLLTDKFLAATGIVDSNIADALNTMESNLRANGLLSKITALYPFVGGTAFTHKFNFMDARDLDVAFRLDLNVNTINNANGCNPNRNASSLFLNSNYFPVDDVHLSYYSRENIPENGVEMGADGDNNFSVVLKWSNLGNISRLSEILNVRSTSILRSDYFGVVSSIPSNTSKKYKNGIFIESNNGSSDIVSSNISFGGGIANQRSSKQCAFASVGYGLSDSEVLALNNIVQTFNTSLGREIPQ